MKFGYPKEEKLKSKKLIERLFTEGKSVSKYPLKLFYLPVVFEDDIKVKAAVSVSKRNFKTAVGRNQVKRLLRETYRLNKHMVTENIDDQYAFIFLYTGKETPEFHFLEKKMRALLKEFALQTKKPENI